MSITNDQLELVIAMSIEDLEAEASFAEGFEIPGPHSRAWHAAVEEELQERIENYLTEGTA